jgi:hypothetical protein
VPVHLLDQCSATIAALTAWPGEKNLSICNTAKNLRFVPAMTAHRRGCPWDGPDRRSAPRLATRCCRQRLPRPHTLGKHRRRAVPRFDGAFKLVSADFLHGLTSVIALSFRHDSGRRSWPGRRCDFLVRLRSRLPLDSDVGRRRRNPLLQMGARSRSGIPPF